MVKSDFESAASPNSAISALPCEARQEAGNRAQEIVSDYIIKIVDVNNSAAEDLKSVALYQGVRKLISYL